MFQCQRALHPARWAFIHKGAQERQSGIPIMMGQLDGRCDLRVFIESGVCGEPLKECERSEPLKTHQVLRSVNLRLIVEGSAIGEGNNFSAIGMPHADTDIYGNKISECWDDAIEAEGGNRNVRIWGNYMDRTMVGVATTVTHVGPVYIFRNVHNRSRYSSLVSTDNDDAGPFGKSGTRGSDGNGRRYVFHNTTLQATVPGGALSLGAGGGLVAPSNAPMTNTVSRKNFSQMN
jgi:hypothetical protein